MFKHRTFKNHAKLKQLTQKKYTYNTCIVIVVFFLHVHSFFSKFTKKWVSYYMNIVIGILFSAYTYKKIDFRWYIFVMCGLTECQLSPGFYLDYHSTRAQFLFGGIKASRETSTYAKWNRIK